MYKFYRTLPNGNWKYCDVFNSTLDSNYHSYIDFCKTNNFSWLFTNTDGLILHSSNDDVYKGRYITRIDGKFQIKE